MEDSVLDEQEIFIKYIGTRIISFKFKNLSKIDNIKCLTCLVKDGIKDEFEQYIDKALNKNKSMNKILQLQKMRNFTNFQIINLWKKHVEMMEKYEKKIFMGQFKKIKMLGEIFGKSFIRDLKTIYESFQIQEQQK
ncbi:hypothetical protein pb186bvf_019052 [Paramecium bursaria]